MKCVNTEWKCRYPNCWKDMEPSEFFCEKHQAFRPLVNDLFERGRPERGVNFQTEPLSAVYVIGCRRTGAVKIGIALDVLARIAQLQTGYPYKLKLYGAFYTKRQWAERIERDCHNKMKEFGLHLQGEWFEIEPDDGVRLVAKMGSLDGMAVLTAAEYGAMLALWDDIDHDIQNCLMPIMKKIKVDWASELLDKARSSDKTRL